MNGTERKLLAQALEAFETDDWMKKLQAAIDIRKHLTEPEPNYTVTRSAWTGRAFYKCKFCGVDFATQLAVKYHKCSKE